ncbi:zinc carboxypeptidase family protein [Stylonychia lemnae]|uniref:Zinc carboxypeptidase family protein n=1 Tax=Stylonychia lemnae TaxID=5949 RepID=A0A078B6W7_STYLE|nr:zinc carboxypeptidase family protein [Stylonychia lemnae]|eukprot:CDW89042.1 zinc carboxypeptidase family protein [Stylonychia lemnae]
MEQTPPTQKATPDNQSAILQPLPLIMRHQIQGGSEEKNLLYGKLRGFNQNRKVNASDKTKKEESSDDSDYFSDLDQQEEKKNEEGKRCRHKEIKDYKCTKCNYQVHNFQSFFDSGQIQTYIRVLFLTESENMMETIYPKNSAGLNQAITPKLIFECYKPTNVIQMREVILYMIHKNLRNQLKNNPQNYSEIKKLINIQMAQDPDAHKYTHKFKNYLKQYRDQKQKIMLSGDTLFIDSLFESGNLEKAYRVSNKGQNYELFMNVDSNTRGHQQWFYFRVRNIKANVRYTFTIRNFTKGQSLYKKGMKVMWKSKIVSKKIDEDYLNQNILFSDKQWHHGWEQLSDQYISDVEYFKSNCERSHIIRGLYKKYFKEDDDTIDTSNVEIKELKFENELKFFSTEPVIEQNNSNQYEENISINSGSISYQRNTMCLTIAGLPLPIITITNQNTDKKYQTKKQVILVSARVHPGETNSSFVFDGFFKFITTTNSQSANFYIAQALREAYIFKLIPIMNPDGVVSGNYRTSLAGVDLNRQWISPHRFIHPPIFFLKQNIEQISKDREILLYCDMHGHSKKKNAFIYACNAAANGGFQSWTKVRLFPRILAKNSYRFNLNDCTFKVQKSKLGTARVVVWKEFSITNSFTLENSFFGYDYGIDGEVREFKVIDYSELGFEIAKSLWEYNQLCAQIQKELNLTKGWLKPKLLLQVTGIPAAEKIKQEIQELKKKKIQNIIQLSPQPNNKFTKMQTQTSIKQSFTLTNNNMNSSQYINDNQNQSKKLRTQPQQKSQNNEDNILLKSIQNDNLKQIIRIQRWWRVQIKNKNLRDDLMLNFDTIQTVDPDKLLNTMDNFTPDDNLEDELGFQSEQTPQSSKIMNKRYKIDDTKDDYTMNTPSNNSRPQFKFDWREYFKIDELEQAYNLILQGKEPNIETEKQESDEGSDSSPSDDNLDIQELYTIIYVRKKYLKREIQQKIQDEQEYLKKFEKYIKKQIKQIKRMGSNQNNSLESIDPDKASPQNDIQPKKFSKITLIKRSKSKEQFQNNLNGGELISRDQGLKQMSKMNRSFNQEDPYNFTAESINNLTENMFMMSSLNNDNNSNQQTSSKVEIKKQLSPTVLNNSINQIGLKKFRLKSPIQKIDQISSNNDQLNSSANQIIKSFTDQNVKDSISINKNANIIQTATQKVSINQRRQLKSLESARDSITSASNDQMLRTNQSQFNDNQNPYGVQMSARPTVNSVQQDRRKSALDSLQKAQNHNYQNLVPQQSQSKTVFMQNQYPLLPLLNMEGTNVKKTNNIYQSQQIQEQYIINREAQTQMKDFIDVSMEMKQKRQQFQVNQRQSIQLIVPNNDNQNTMNTSSQSFFNKRIKSKSPDYTHAQALNNSGNQQLSATNSLMVIPQNKTLNSNQSQQIYLQVPQTTNISGIQKQSFKLQGLIPSMPIQTQQRQSLSSQGNIKQPIYQKQQQQQQFSIEGNNYTQRQLNQPPNYLESHRVHTNSQLASIKNRKINSLSPQQQKDSNYIGHSKMQNNYIQSVQNQSQVISNQVQDIAKRQHQNVRLNERSLSPNDKVNLLENLGSDDEGIADHIQEINQIANEMMIMRQHQQFTGRSFLGKNNAFIEQKGNPKYQNRK